MNVIYIRFMHIIHIDVECLFDNMHIYMYVYNTYRKVYIIYIYIYMHMHVYANICDFPINPKIKGLITK